MRNLGMGATFKVTGITGAKVFILAAIDREHFMAINIKTGRYWGSIRAASSWPYDIMTVADLRQLVGWTVFGKPYHVKILSYGLQRRKNWPLK